MPNIDLTFETGSLDEAQQTAIARELCDILMEIEGTKGSTGIALAGTWVILNEVKPHSIAAGGRRDLPQPCFRMIVTVPAGALNFEKKSAAVERLSLALLKIIGSEPTQDQRLRVYCLINDLAEPSWGFMGHLFTAAELKGV